MVGASGSIADGEQRDDELVDVADVPLTELLGAREDSPVQRSIRRLQASLEDPNGVLSAFSSFIASP
ncbi:hypothetical protein [Paractinoplanes durhamensis]|uniref:hypothetical protein n=1 Tax=Paractinoplanes durhamensis TaxID=113563 RepID=UPI0019457414|nr:hypothetical protein [Actinoplanes durhamensis]